MKRILLVSAAAMVLTACTSPVTAPGDGTGGGGTPVCDPALGEALGRWADAGFSGSIALTTGGRTDCRASFGRADASAGVPNTDDTVFAIGSVSKAFTAAAVLELVAAGELSLDDRAGGILPGLGGPAAEATIEELLLHTSGLTGIHGSDHRPLGRDEAVAALSGFESAFEPGSDFLYGDGGYTLLALVLDEVTEKGYREFMAAEVLTLAGGRRIGGFWDGEPAPAGPRAVGYEDGEPAEALGDFDGPHWALAGNGDLAMTAAELAAWVDALFSGDLIAPEAVELLTSTAFEYEDGTEVPGWVRLDEDVLGVPAYTVAGGGGDTGHEAVAVWLPESRRALAVTSNTSELTAGDLVRAIGPALASGGPVPVPEIPAVEADPAELRARAGSYALDSGGVLTVEAADDGLVVTADGADAVAAMTTPTSGVTAADLERHEENVLALLEGRTAQGRRERGALESDLGPIEGVEPAGTLVEDSELRTYVLITAGGGPVLAWYAVDGHGALGAVSVGVEPPAFRLVPVGDGGYRREDPGGAGPGVRVGFDGDLMTVTGPDGTAEALRTA